MTDPNFEAELWQTAVRLRGTVAPADYKHYVLPLLFLRYLTLPSTSAYLGFTDTPIDKEDANTLQLFGDYIYIYDMQQAREDNAVVKILYEARHIPSLKPTTKSTPKWPNWPPNTGSKPPNWKQPKPARLASKEPPGPKTAPPSWPPTCSTTSTPASRVSPARP